MKEHFSVRLEVNWNTWLSSPGTWRCVFISVLLLRNANTFYCDDAGNDSLGIHRYAVFALKNYSHFGSCLAVEMWTLKTLFPRELLGQFAGTPKRDEEALASQVLVQWESRVLPGVSRRRHCECRAMLTGATGGATSGKWTCITGNTPGPSWAFTGLCFHELKH